MVNWHYFLVQHTFFIILNTLNAWWVLWPLNATNWPAKITLWHEPDHSPFNRPRAQPRLRLNPGTSGSRPTCPPTLYHYPLPTISCKKKKGKKGGGTAFPFQQQTKKIGYLMARDVYNKEIRQFFIDVFVSSAIVSKWRPPTKACQKPFEP